LIPGTLTVVIGATGIGKTQFGLQFANAGSHDERQRGVIFDVSARGDSQNHADYARRMCNWALRCVDAQRSLDLTRFFEDLPTGDYLHLFDYHGRRVTRQDLEFEQWRNWQAELNAKLRVAIAFLYANFVAGVRRVVVDGVEPVDRPHESIQFQLFEYLYHQVLRKDPEWVARDLFREHYRQNAEQAARHVYDPRSVACLLLYTSQEAMLDELISRSLDEGDLLAGANTLIYLGKFREGRKLRRGMYIAKHRGSDCSEEIQTYEIDADGLRLDGQ
jgi:KaiC/GvpD/RAD55 family RecA-like ATPase